MLRASVVNYNVILFNVHWCWPLDLPTYYHFCNFAREYQNEVKLVSFILCKSITKSGNEVRCLLLSYLQICPNKIFISSKISKEFEFMLNYRGRNAQTSQQISLYSHEIIFTYLF